MTEVETKVLLSCANISVVRHEKRLPAHHEACERSEFDTSEVRDCKSKETSEPSNMNPYLSNLPWDVDQQVC